MKTLTISRKVSLGFAALLVLTALLGGLAVTSMRTVQGAARTLAREYVPEVDVAAALQSHVSAANLAIRSYGLSADATYLTEARKELVAVQAQLGVAQKLALDHPNLTQLRDDVAELGPTLKAYETAIAATVARNEDIAEKRIKLNESAAEFITNIDALIEAQQGRLQSEIKDGAESALLLERTRKLTLAWEIRALGNAARIGVFKAQALRDNTIFTEALGNFPPMETRLTELLGLLKVRTDIEELDHVKASASAYRDAVQAVLDDSVALIEIGKQRADAANHLLALAEHTQNAGVKRTIEAADYSDEHLAMSATTILIGIAVSLAIGAIVAFVIIRGTTRSLTTIADNLNGNALQVTSAAGQVATASQTLAEGATEQAASLEETSASLEEMSSMTKRNADSAQQAKELSHLTRNSADHGAQHMQEMHQAMDAIKASSNDIAKIIKTIDEIAFQTNILALNAAVEAARAGEAGMGFAVVADEVRNLAQRSAQSAKETAQKIEDAIKKSEHGVAISGKVATSLGEIVEKARQMDALIGEIAVASAEQNQGIGQLNTAVSQMDRVTQSNASSAEESAAAAEELNAQAASLQQAVVDLRRLVVTDATSQAAVPAPTEQTLHLPTRSTPRKPAAPSRREPALVKPTRPQSQAAYATVTPGADDHDDFFRG